jgi:hypothetical protein
MAVPQDLYDKRVRGRVSLLACRGCGGKIRLDGSSGGAHPVVAGGLWLGEEPENPEAGPPSSAPMSMRQPIARIGRYALFDQFASGGMAQRPGPWAGTHIGRSVKSGPARDPLTNRLDPLLPGRPVPSIRADLE